MKEEVTLYLFEKRSNLGKELCFWFPHVVSTPYERNKVYSFGNETIYSEGLVKAARQLGVKLRLFSDVPRKEGIATDPGVFDSLYKDGFEFYTRLSKESWASLTANLETILARE